MFYKIINNKLYIVDEIADNRSFILFISTYYQITLWHLNKFHIKDNIYISCILLQEVDKNKIQLLNDCIQELCKNRNQKAVQLAVKKLKYIHLFDITQYFGVYAFDKGVICFKHLFIYTMWLVNEKCLANNTLKRCKLNFIPLAVMQHQDKLFYLNSYITKKLDYQIIHNLSTELQNAFYLTNCKNTFVEMLKFQFDTGKIIFYDEDYI